jgi:hypothetical protein
MQLAARGTIVIGFSRLVPTTRARIEQLKERKNLLLPIAMAAYLTAVRRKTARLCSN